MNKENKFEGVDICSKCGGTAEYGTMSDINPVDFDLICDKCKKKRVDK